MDFHFCFLFAVTRKENMNNKREFYQSSDIFILFIQRAKPFFTGFCSKASNGDNAVIPEAVKCSVPV